MRKKQTMQEKLLARLRDDLGEFGTCDLGSCQYAATQAYYNFTTAYLEYNRAEFEELMGITYDKTLTEEEFIASLQKTLWDDWSEDEDKELEDEPNIEDIEDYYEYTKDQAWDLWSAAEMPLENFNAEPKGVPSPNSETGWLLNDLIINYESLMTGLAIGYTTHLYGTSIDTFSDFST